MGALLCVRCTRGVVADADGSWICERHGPVEGLADAMEFGPEALATLLYTDGAVPAWVPWPLPPDWSVTGVRRTGEGAAAMHAVAVSCTGPGMLGGVAELVVVAEEPGVGLGARYAGRTQPDPGPALTTAAPDTKVFAAGHPTPLWSVPGGSDRAVYVGEALGRWLWLVVWPATEFMVVHDHLSLVDLRDPTLAYELPTGELSGPILE